ncbi:MAG: hypothetical protein M0C28_00130 [Candidatus Moduliflexus flocculans]|nr:hypothetical protein [Candidatus Moduliflexus flocculans]
MLVVLVFRSAICQVFTKAFFSIRNFKLSHSLPASFATSVLKERIPQKKP